MTVFILVGGLLQPYLVCWIAWALVFMRVAYVIGYITKGPDARLFGAVAALLPVYGLGLYSLFSLTKN